MRGKIGVLEEPRSVTIEEYSVPDPRPQELLMRVDMAGLDGTDVKTYKGELPSSEISAYPQVMSDELVGTVEARGEGTGEKYGVQVGDRIIVGPRITCKECGYCQSGNHAHCDEMRTYGRMNPREPPHFSGGCAEYLLVRPGSNVYRIPDDVTDKEALLSSITLPDGLRSADLAGVQVGDTVVVLGPGPQGLSSVIGARARGANEIITVGLPTDESRLEFSEALGATRTVTTGEEDLRSVVSECTDGEMADVVFECTGNSSVLEGAFDLIKPQGVCHVVSMAEGDVTINPFELVMEEISIIPRRGPTPKYVRQALKAITSWEFPVEDIVTGTYPLEGISEACETVSSGSEAGERTKIKAAITPQRT